jgi:putative ABC transport system permease protein
MFVHVRTDPYALITPITKTIRDMSIEQPVERAATLEDVRAEVLTPDRLNTMVFGGFAIVALTIAVVGVGGVLAFSVSARTREFAIRLAIGSQPRHLLTRVIGEGPWIRLFLRGPSPPSIRHSLCRPAAAIRRPR